MALAIDPEECVICNACEPVCPSSAISRENNTFVIDPKLCAECEGFFDSSQCVSVCPVHCIQPATYLPPVPTVKRARLYQQVVKLLNKPDNNTFK